MALLRPLVDAGLLPADYPLAIHAVSGYSGRGRAGLADHEGDAAVDAPPFQVYGLGLEHKHVPEITRQVGLTHRPLFAPAVGRYAQGMIVETLLPLWALPARPSLGDVRAALAGAYAGERFVEVASMDAAAALRSLDPEGLNGTNRLRLFVFGNAGESQARLVALLDNLGKGAAGAAVQNLNLRLGLDEAAGLITND